MNSLRLVGLFLLCAFVMLCDTDAGGPVVTPEPNTIVLLAAGLAGIGFAAWRRNRKR